MPKVRIKNLRPNDPQRLTRLWECIGTSGIFAQNIIEANKDFIVIANDETIENITARPLKEKATQHGFEVIPPPEAIAKRTLVIKNINKNIQDSSNDEVKESIERSNDVVVEEVIRIPSAPRLLKIRLESANMATQAINGGLRFMYQSFPPQTLEREIRINIPICYICYSYNHEKKDCTTPDLKLCSECSEEGHNFRDCNSQIKKCLTCGGDHRTLADRCPIRKQKRKEIMKNINEKKRERSRSRSRQRPNAPTYAQATIYSNQPREDQHLQVDHSNNNLFAVVVSSMTMAYLNEALSPGSFQDTMDKMFKLNNIPTVKFIKPENPQGILNIMGQIKMSAGDQVNQPTQEEEQEGETAPDTGIEEMITEQPKTPKRARVITPNKEAETGAKKKQTGAALTHTLRSSKQQLSATEELPRPLEQRPPRDARADKKPSEHRSRSSSTGGETQLSFRLYYKESKQVPKQRMSHNQILNDILESKAKVFHEEERLVSQFLQIIQNQDRFTRWPVSIHVHQITDHEWDDIYPAYHRGFITSIKERGKKKANK